MSGKLDRARIVAMVVAGVAAGGAAWLVWGGDSAPSGTLLLPDLAARPPIELHTGKEEGRDLLYFTSQLVNVGTGDFRVEARKNGGQWDVVQQVSSSEGGMERIPVEPDLVWGGDGHQHWHVRRILRFVLTEEGAALRSSAGSVMVDTKIGFCFYDSDSYRLELPGAPASARYRVGGCGTEFSGELTMGLSVGWADTYVWTLPGQSIDITGIPDGRYRLWAVADEDGWFREESRGNNTTWIDVAITTRDDGNRLVDPLESAPEP